MTIKTATLVPLIARNTYRFELWTGTEDIHETIIVENDYDVNDALNDMIEEKNHNLTILAVSFTPWSAEDKNDPEIPAWNTKAISATVSF